MSNKNEVFEYLIDQLRRQLPVVDVMGEIERWSIDRSIAGRGNYTDEENAIIDAYIGLEHNPYKQQCEGLAHEVLSLKNQLRDASALVAELQKELDTANSTVVRLRKEIAKSTGDIGEYIDAMEQSGCCKEDTQYNAWRPHYGARQPVPDGTMVFIRYRNGEEPKHSVAAEKRSWIWDGTYADIVEYKIDTQECEHDYRLVLWCSDLQQCSKCGVIK